MDHITKTPPRDWWNLNHRTLNSNRGEIMLEYTIVKTGQRKDGRFWGMIEQELDSGVILNAFIVSSKELTEGQVVQLPKNINLSWSC